MKNAVFGYARVSTKEQNEGRQIAELIGAGVHENNIFLDKQSGKDFKRKEYQFLVENRLGEGDLLIISSIDRLGRNYNEILEQWRHITQVLKANIKVLDMPLLDTTASSQSLDSKFIADLVLQILSYVANKERENIRKRQADGIALAKAQGKPLGRPKAQKPDNWDEVYTKWKSKLITAVKAMELLNMKPNTFYKFVKEEKEAITE